MRSELSVSDKTNSTLSQSFFPPHFSQFSNVLFELFICVYIFVVLEKNKDIIDGEKSVKR